jgi:hypothetical protein
VENHVSISHFFHSLAKTDVKGKKCNTYPSIWAPWLLWKAGFPAYCRMVGKMNLIVLTMVLEIFNSMADDDLAVRVLNGDTIGVYAMQWGQPI